MVVDSQPVRLLGILIQQVIQTFKVYFEVVHEQFELAAVSFHGRVHELKHVTDRARNYSIHLLN